MFKMNFINNQFLKAIFLSTIIILIPFLEFIKANLFEIDFAIYSQLLLYLISVSTLILILILFLLLFKVKKQPINNIIITVAFTYWIFFKFEYLREKLNFFYKIISLNDEILVYLSSCLILFVIVVIIYKLLLNKLFKKFFNLFFIIHFLFVISFISFLIFKDNFNLKNNILVKNEKNFFSKKEISKILENNNNLNIYYIIMDGMTSLNEYEKILNNNNSNQKLDNKVSDLINFYKKNDYKYIENSYSTFKDTHHTLGSLLNLYPLQLKNLKKDSFIYQSSLYPAPLSKHNFEINKYPQLIKVLTEINYEFKWLGYKLNCKFLNPDLCYDFVISNKSEKFYNINFYVLKSYLLNTPVIDLYKFLKKNLNIKINLPDREKLSETNIYNSKFEVISDFILNNKKYQKKNKSYFYLIHNILPKLDDYYFHKNCNAKNTNLGDITNNYILYVDNYECALLRIKEMIEYIDKFDPDAVVIIQGDQGNSFFENEHLDNYKIFNLIKVPVYCKNYLTNEIDNVNGVRLSLSCATGTDIKLIKRKFYDENNL